MTNEEIAIKVKQGDTSLLGDLWEQTYKLMYQLARGYRRRLETVCDRAGVMLDDLYQVCYFALLNAVEAYKPDKAYKFNSYLDYHLRNEFNRLTGMQTAAGRKNVLTNALSIDKPSGADEEMTLANRIPDKDAEIQFSQVEDDELSKSINAKLSEAIETLTPYQQEVVRRRYYENETQKEIAEAKGCAHSYVGQVERNALGKLRRSKQMHRIRNEIVASGGMRGISLKTYRYTFTSSVEATILRLEREGLL